MNSFTLSRRLVFILCAMASFSASHAADTLPGAAAEKQAERLERRAEIAAAQMHYTTAFTATFAAARAEPDKAAPAWARAEFLLEKMVDLATTSGDSEGALKVLSTLTKTSREGVQTPPALCSRATWLLAQAHLRGGNVAAARQTIRPLGLLRDWLIVGPFDNERGRAFADRLPPETTAPVAGHTFVGKKRSVAWREVSTAEPLGGVNLAAYFRPQTESLAYALCLIEVKTAQTVVLRAGSDDALAVWLNGREVARIADEREADLDQTIAPLALRAGWNVLLLKIGQSRGDWKFYARLTRPDGTPLTNVRTAHRLADVIKHYPTLTTTTTPAENITTATDVTIATGALHYYEQRARGELAAPRDQYILGYLLHRRHLSGAARAAERLLRTAAKNARTNGVYWLASARATASRDTPDREENPRREALERARQLTPHEIAATVQLGHYYLNRMGNLSRASRLAEQAREANPLSPQAQLLQAKIYRARGWTVRAAVLLGEILRRNPACRAAQIEAGEIALRQNHLPAAVRAFRAAAQLDATDTFAAQQLYAALQRSGQQAKATALLHKFLTLQPYTTWATKKLIHEYRQQNNPHVALQLVDAALKIAPEDHEMLALRGHVLLAMDNKDAAYAAWDKALLLQPAYLPLRDYLRLRGREAPRDTTRIVDLGAYVNAAKNYPSPPGASYLYLLRERANRVNADGTRRRTHHLVFRVADPAKTKTLSRFPIYYDPEFERVIVHTARVLRADGSLHEARLSGPRSGGGGRDYWLLQFPRLSRDDVVQVEYSIDRFRTDFFGDYYGEIFQFRRHVPARRTRYSITTPLDRTFYFHRTGAIGKPKITRDKQMNTQTRVWEMSAQTAIVIEEFMPPQSELSPTVQVSTFQNWDALARWYWHLIKSQNSLSPRISAKARDLTVGKKTDREKVAALHSWVTRNIRPVAWEFGVHGYKPYRADTIFRRRFGDCKDTATLINVMARDIGLAAWPVLLKLVRPQQPTAGRGREDFTLPVLHHFNHCIALVRIAGRDVLIDGVGGRRVLANIPFSDAGATGIVVMPGKARTIIVPPLTAAKNAWDESGTLTIKADGALDYSFTLTGRGEVSYRLRRYFRSAAKYHARVFSAIAGQTWGEHTIRKVKVARERSGGAATRLSASLRLGDLTRVSGETMRVRVPREFLRGAVKSGAPFPEALRVFAQHSRRVHDVVLPMPFRIQRRLMIHAPPGWRLANLPAPVSLRYAFGTVTFSLTGADGVYQLASLIEITKSRIAVKEYADFRNLCITADRIADVTFEFSRR